MQNSFKRNLIKINHHYPKNHQHLWNLPKFTNEPEPKFTSGEVQAAIKQMQNDKSAERGNIKPEHIKYGTENIAKGIATIYKDITRTGKLPNKINQW